MAKRKAPVSPSEIPVPDQNPETHPDYQPEAPLLPDEDPGVVPPQQPDNPWPEKVPPQTEPKPA